MSSWAASIIGSVRGGVGSNRELVFSATLANESCCAYVVVISDISLCESLDVAEMTFCASETVSIAVRIRVWATG